MPSWISPFALCSWLGVVGVVTAARLFRSRAYALFRGILLSIYTLLAVCLIPHTGALWPIAWGLHVIVYVQSLGQVWPRMWPSAYRVLVSLPAAYFSASMLLALPWALVSAVGLPPYGLWVPFALGALGLVQSLVRRVELRPLHLTGAAHEPGDAPRRVSDAPTSPATATPLRVVQITDPHLGPFMSVRQLRDICERAVARAPDLILLTGDYLTMESQGDARWLTEALAPLARARGRVFACLGNHDHEALPVVTAALDAAGVTLLVDEQVTVQTRAGAVQVIGFDYHFADRAQRIAQVLERSPRQAERRLALLHDPGAFKHLPAGAADLTLSGHTHGGQVGLVSLGHPGTLAGWIAKIPDHGLWARGGDYLYVHRGSGHYGFPLRVGVPAEESELRITWALPTRAPVR